MDELKRNGSGYYDPTAYQALKKIERREKEMEIRKGEIWEVEMGNNIRTVLVLAVHGSYSTVLTFSDEQRERRTVQMNAQGMKYTEPGMVTYKFHDAFDKFIRLATDEEFADIMNQIAGALGIESKYPDEKTVAWIEELDKTKIELAEALRSREHFKNLFESLEKPETETIKLQTERDLYKSQYESLLERVLAKAV